MSSTISTHPQEGIVLSALDYEARDQIIKVLTEKGIISVYAKGTQALKSKNRRLTLPFSHVKLNLYDRKEEAEGMEKLFNGDLIDNYGDLLEDLMLSALLALLRDLLFHSDITPLIYQMFLKTLQDIRKDKEKAASAAAYFMSVLLKENGIEPYVDGCVVCQRRNRIERLSMNAGGFLCHEHNKNSMKKMEPSKLRAYRLLFKAPPDKREILFENAAYTYDEVDYLARWFMNYFSLELPSLSFFETVLKMQ